MKRSSLAVLATLAALPMAVIASAAISTVASTSAPAAHTFATTLADADGNDTSIDVSVPNDNVTANSALITWEPVNFVSGGYEVTIKDFFGVAVDTQTVTGLHYTTHNLKPSSFYTVTVKTVNAPQAKGTNTIDTLGDPGPAS